MLSVDEALRLVLDHAQPLRSEVVPVGVLFQVLAETIISDIDSPPHDNSMVYGYAVLSSEITRPGVELTVLEEVVAGSLPTKTVGPRTATRIMTGAPLPPGADAVVMVEQTSINGNCVVIHAPNVKTGQNIMR